MEDTKSLLMMVLHKIFHNQPKTVENTFQLIHNFNNGKIENKNYEKTLKAICDLMNDKLPSPILVYILTLVDMPQDFDSQSPLMEKMKKTHDFFPEINVRPHLLEYLNSTKPTSNITKRSNIELETEKNDGVTGTVTSEKIVNNQSRADIKQTRSIRKPKKLSKAIRSPKHLLDICAVYVVSNEKYLKTMYKKKLALAWSLINSNALCDDKLKQCYDVVKELNKKVKWLRDMESESVSPELLMEEYGNSDIFLKENHITFHELEKSFSEVPKVCDKIISELLQTE